MNWFMARGFLVYAFSEDLGYSIPEETSREREVFVLTARETLRGLRPPARKAGVCLR